MMSAIFAGLIGSKAYASEFDVVTGEQFPLEEATKIVSFFEESQVHSEDVADFFTQVKQEFPGKSIVFSKNPSETQGDQELATRFQSISGIAQRYTAQIFDENADVKVKDDTSDLLLLNTGGSLGDVTLRGKNVAFYSQGKATSFLIDAKDKVFGFHCALHSDGSVILKADDIIIQAVQIGNSQNPLLVHTPYLNASTFNGGAYIQTTTNHTDDTAGQIVVHPQDPIALDSQIINIDQLTRGFMGGCMMMATVDHKEETTVEQLTDSAISLESNTVVPELFTEPFPTLGKTTEKTNN